VAGPVTVEFYDAQATSYAGIRSADPVEKVDPYTTPVPAYWYGRRGCFRPPRACTARAEAVSRGLEFVGAKIGGCKFPVKNDGDRAVLVVDGLHAPGDIDDAQSAHAQGGAIRYMVSIGVGAAMGNGIAHRTHANRRPPRWESGPRQNPRSAHSISFLLQRGLLLEEQREKECLQSTKALLA